MQAKTKRVQYVMTYIKENTNINEHRRFIVKLYNKIISKSAYRDIGELAVFSTTDINISIDSSTILNVSSYSLLG